MDVARLNMNYFPVSDMKELVNNMRKKSRKWQIMCLAAFFVSRSEIVFSLMLKLMLEKPRSLPEI
jgi:hypothetical protein